MSHRKPALAARATSPRFYPEQTSAAARPGTPSARHNPPPPRGLTDKIVWRLVAELKAFPGNPRRHPEAQIVRLMRSIKRVWTNPILIDDFGTILAGHGRLEAA